MLRDGYHCGMSEDRTTAVVERYLDQLAKVASETTVEPLVRELLGQSVNRLHQLCASMLFRKYPRLTQPPLNLRPEEILSAVVERMIKAMRQVRPTGARQFFALANQHMRWELNDLARRLDHQAAAVEVHESQVAAPVQSSESQVSPNMHRILAAIEELPEEEREVFSLLRVQGLTQPEAAEVLGVSTKTVQRRLNRCLLLLVDKLGDLQPAPKLQQ
jgi:RNA polymerase sigma-70 factor (ECF subfamily)